MTAPTVPPSLAAQTISSSGIGRQDAVDGVGRLGRHPGLLLGDDLHARQLGHLVQKAFGPGTALIGQQRDEAHGGDGGFAVEPVFDVLGDDLAGRLAEFILVALDGAYGKIAFHIGIVGDDLNALIVGPLQGGAGGLFAQRRNEDGVDAADT